MTKTTENPAVVRQSRIRIFIVPREHGAWGLLLIPLFTGIVAGIASTQRIWPTLLFAVAALLLFWLRTPVESLLGTGLVHARAPREWRIVLGAAVTITVASAVCLTLLMWKGRNSKLVLIGAIAALAFLLQVILRRLGRRTRMMAQLVGAIGLTSTAPAAYYIATGHLDERAFALWIANWLFAGGQIHFVQLRIHAARSGSFSEKFARGWIFFLAQPIVLLSLGLASVWRLIPSLVIIAFIPAVVRGTLWFFRRPEPLDVKRLGWSEMKQGIAFGILLAMAFIFS